jgi:non-ribosomal peptide synthetase component E (peptide arylation enzyme)/thioesterase domain-containing protein/aryl carrier-like protein
LRDLARRRHLRILEVATTPGSPAGAFRFSDGRGRARDPREDDTALVLHTSGTTARPKIVPLTQGLLTLSAHNIAATLRLTPDDRCLNVMPLFHIHGLVGALLASLSAGASVICASGFHAPSFHGLLNELEPTWYTAVPTMHQAVLARTPSAGTSLRFIRSSSAPLPPRVHEELEEAFGVPVIEAYGMTEAAHQMASNPLPPGARKPGSVGLATGIDIAVLGADDRPAPASETGDVVIKGPTVFAGYESNREANSDSFTNGWFRTGDEGLLDDDGYLFLKGRSKEIINRGGEKVAPAEVEDAILGHPDVVQAVSFAVPNTRLGEDVGAAVVLREGSHVTEHELQERVASRLADFKVPSVVVFVDDIPKGPTGKLQRIGLAERLGVVESARAPQQAYVAPRDAFEREIAELWAETLDVDRVGVEDDFFSLGGDSILGAELLARIAERHGRTLPLTTLMWAPTLGAFTTLVEDGSWDEESLIVPVQSGGRRPALFVTHALGDEALNVSVLKRTLGEDQPLYAVRAKLESFDHRSVEDIADYYFGEIRAVQPSGPYLFASMCSGGAIVMELARRAQASGEEVRLAAVIDPQTQLGRRGVRHYARRAMEHTRNRRLRWAARRKLRHWLGHLMPEKYPDPEVVDPLKAVMASLRRGYRITRFPGTLTVISTMDYETPRSFWEGVADRVSWYEVEAPHRTIFQHPHADVLGEVLDTVLRDAEQEAAS